MPERRAATAIWGQMRSWLMLIVSIAALSIYLLTLSPGLTWANDGVDGGELAAAAYTLGIAHPPGYPTYLLLVHPLTYLPFGEVATRTNLFSALCAAGAVALVTWSLREQSWFAALGSGLTLAIAPLLWSQAVITEVHTLNALLIALILGLALKAHTNDAKWLVGVLGAVWGLSLGNHPSAIISVSLLVWAVWRPEIGVYKQRLGYCIAGIVLGLLVYIYLPLRAMAYPPINWGNPQTWDRFIWMVLGGPYRRFLFGLPLQFWSVRLVSLPGLLTQQFGLIGVAGIIVGIGALVRRRGLLVATGVVVLFSIVLAIGYDTTDSYLYLIPALICLTFWLGIGIDQIGIWIAERKRSYVWIIIVLALLGPLLTMVLRFPQMKLGPDAQVAEFRHAVLDAAPVGSVIWSTRDAHTFTLWYWQYTRGERSDLIVIDADLIGYDWYVNALMRHWPELSFSMLLDDEMLAQQLARPVCRIENVPLSLSCVKLSP